MLRCPCSCLAWLATLMAAAVVAEKSLPSSWKRCSRSDPDLDKCLVVAANEVLAELASSGSKEFGIPPIDPFKISRLRMEQGTGSVSLNLEMKNVTLTGLKDTRFKSIRSNLSNYIISGTLETIPLLTLSGDYKMNGKVLVLPITGQGFCFLTLAKVFIEVTLYGKEIVKNGHKFMKVTEIHFDTIEPESSTTNFENLFKGNKQLSDQVNKFLTDNWRPVLKELKPVLGEAMGAALLDTANKVMTKVPFDKIFLNN